MLYRKKSSTPFLQLSNHRRKEQYIQIKNRIRSDYVSTGFYFHTIDCLDDQYNATWSDIYFLSRKYKNVFYNATIDIAQNKLISDAEDVISDLWTGSISAYGSDLFSLKSTKAVYKNGKIIGRSIDFSAWDVKREDLGGMSVSEYHDVLVDGYLEKKPPVFEEFQLHDDFAFGVGLDIIVDEEKITYAIVDKYIQLFYDRGEVEWKSDTPVSPERLIYKRNWHVGKGVSLSNVVNL